MASIWKAYSKVAALVLAYSLAGGVMACGAVGCGEVILWERCLPPEDYNIKLRITHDVAPVGTPVELGWKGEAGECPVWWRVASIPEGSMVEPVHSLRSLEFVPDVPGRYILELHVGQVVRRAEVVAFEPTVEIETRPIPIGDVRCFPMAVAGRRLFCADQGADVVRVFDIESGDMLSEVHLPWNSAWFFNLDANHQMLAVVRLMSEINLFAVSDEGRVEHQADLDRHGGGCYKSALVGDLLLLACLDLEPQTQAGYEISGYEILNVAVPTAPERAGCVPVEESGELAFAATDDLLFVKDKPNRLSVHRIQGLAPSCEQASAPLSSVETRVGNSGSLLWGEHVLAHHRGWLYLGGAGGIQVFDVRDPTEPRDVTVLDHGLPWQMVVHQGYLYVTLFPHRRLVIYDLSSPHLPRLVGASAPGKADLLASGGEGPLIAIEASRKGPVEVRIH